MQEKLFAKRKLILIVMAVIFAAASVFLIRTTDYGFYAALKIGIVFLVLSFIYAVLIKGVRGIWNWMKEHKRRLIKVLLLEAFMLFYLYFFVHVLKNAPTLYHSAQITLGFLIMLLILVTFFLTESKRISIDKIYLILGISMGMIFLIMQPAGIVPDEKAHLYAAYDVSNSMMQIDRAPDGSLMMREDDSKTSLEPVKRPSNYFRKKHEAYWQSLNDPLQSENMVSIHKEPIRTQRYQYFIPALGLTLGRTLHLGTQAVFFLGRLFNMLWFVLVTAYAIRRLPFGKMALVVLALTPISLQQSASFSYDVFVNSTAFLIVALTMHLAYEKENNIPVSKGRARHYIQMGILMAACILMVPLKGYVYAPVCFLPLILVVKKWKTNRREALFYLTVLGICAAVFAVRCLLPVVQQKGVFSAGETVSYTGEEGDVTYTLSYIRENKDEWIKVLFNTSRIFKSSYLESMIANPLGWLTIEVNTIMVYVYVLLLMIASFRKSDEEVCMTSLEKVWIHIMTWGSAAAVILALWLSWSPVSQQRIDGIQGRYFIPVCLPMLLTIRSDRIQAKHSVNGPIFTAVLTCLFFTVYYRIP